MGNGKGYLLSLDGSDGMYYSSDVRIYYSELTIKENKNLEIIFLLKTMKDTELR